MNTELSERQEKLKKIKRLLLDEHVLVHLKPTVPGVDLPEHLRSSPTVTLKLSTLFRGALDVQDELIVAELLFNAEYYRCLIPIDAIGALTSATGETFFWSEPPSLSERVSSAPLTAKKAPATAKRPSGSPEKRPMLRRVK